MKGVDTMVYGYARVSTKEQKEDRQIIALKEYGIKKCNIYSEKQSGKDFDRGEYQNLLKKLKHGDVLVVKSIDRLGRNYREVIKQWQFITQDINADIIVLDMPILNTTQHKDLIGTLISDIVLQLLSYVAESERINIKQRQAEGIAIAKEKGIQFGRPRKYNAVDYISIYLMFIHKEITQKQAMEMIGCCESTYYRIVNELRAIIKNH